MTRRIEVVPYDPEWLKLYESEEPKIVDALGGEAVRIHHIGSTAIPGIKAKPVIDILVEVRTISVIDGYNPAMMDLNFIPRGENGIPGRRYFIKNIEDIRMCHVHMFQVGNPEITRHLNFRDYLRAHPEDSQAYSQLKEKLAEIFREDSLGYTNGKDKFIERIDKRAKEWVEG